MLQFKDATMEGCYKSYQPGKGQIQSKQYITGDINNVPHRRGVVTLCHTGDLVHTAGTKTNIKKILEKQNLTLLSVQ